MSNPHANSFRFIAFNAEVNLISILQLDKNHIAPDLQSVKNLPSSNYMIASCIINDSLVIKNEQKEIRVNQFTPVITAVKDILVRVSATGELLNLFDMLNKPESKYTKILFKYLQHSKNINIPKQKKIIH